MVNIWTSTLNDLRPSLVEDNMDLDKTEISNLVLIMEFIIRTELASIGNVALSWVLRIHLIY